MDQIEDLPDCIEKVELLEQAILLADEEHQLDHGYYLRQRYIYLANSFGYDMRMLVAFLWCLEKYDQQPDRFDEHEMLWQFKWIMTDLAGFPQLNREKIEQMAKDMRERYERSGWALGPVWNALSSVHFYLGEWDKSRACKEEVLRSEVDAMSDCPACRQQMRVRFFHEAEDYERAIEEAKIIFKSSMRCRTVPERTHQVLMSTYLKLDQYNESKEHLNRLEQTTVFDLEHYWVWLDIVGVNSYIDLSRAVQLYLKYFNMIAQQELVYARLQGYLTGAELFQRWLVERPEETKAMLGFPSKFEFVSADGDYEVAKLQRWFEEKTFEIAHQFDRRNGNAFFTDRVQRRMKKAQEWARKAE